MEGGLGKDVAVMDELSAALAALDTAVETLDRVVDRADSSPEELANVVAVLALTVRAQVNVLHRIVETAGSPL